MIRKLARIVTVGAVTPIPKADRIECARAGGWPVCVKKGQFHEGQLAVYFEIDAFLPQGNPLWEFLMADQATTFNGVVGHRLKSQEQRGQLSQGLLLPLEVLPPEHRALPVGTDVTGILNVVKHEKPLTEQLMAISDGYRPGVITSTDLMRVQNLREEGLWDAICESPYSWQVTEKLEGEATHFGFVDGAFKACSTQLSFKNLPDNPRWDYARSIQLDEKLAHTPNIILQGEMVGPGFEGNHYRLSKPEFFLYRAIDLSTGQYLQPGERRLLASDLGVREVPVIREQYFFNPGDTEEHLLALANGPSLLNPAVRREGLALENRQNAYTFKVISDRYLVNAKMTETERTQLFPAAQERLGKTCIDSGTCHHSCTTKCFRRSGCAPLSCSGLTDKEFSGA